MARAFGVHLLVAVLLACPFPCLGKAAAGSGAACTGENCAGGDGCCPTSGANSDQGAPRAPVQGGGETCLCHGAVMDRHVSPPSLNLQIVATVSADELSQQLGPRAADNAGRLNPSACDFASVPSGRILRAHLASFLI